MFEIHDTDSISKSTMITALPVDVTQKRGLVKLSHPIVEVA